MADPSLTDITVPINTPDAFGAPEVSSTGTMTVIDSIATAPQTDPSRSRPGVPQATSRATARMSS